MSAHLLSGLTSAPGGRQAGDRNFNASLEQLMSGVESRFGIKPGGLVERKLARVMQMVPLPELEHWVSRMNSYPGDHPEWQSLVECLTVHETYFYREPDLMDMTRKEIIPYLLSLRERERRLKIWSSACSTGEEAYDLAFMALKVMLGENKVAWNEFGARPVDGWSLSVFASDLSNQVLRTARDGVYSNIAMGSIRSMPGEWMDILQPAPQPDDRNDSGERFFAVRDWLRSYVRFSHFNLLDKLPPFDGIDLVFCRNVLIYFEDDAKKQVQTMLARAIAPGGVMVLGSAVRLLAPEYFESRFGHGGSWYVRNDTKVFA